MIIWTTAGLFSILESPNPDYVIIEARTENEIDLLKQTLKLIDLWDDGVLDIDEGRQIRLRKVDACEWFGFELDWWLGEGLGKQLLKGGAIKEAVALEKLMMALEGEPNGEAKTD